MKSTGRRRRVGAIRLGVGAVILLIVAGIWGLFLSGELSVQRVTSGSMEPAFLEGDVLLVKRYEGQDLKPGDLVVVESPDDDLSPMLKRVVAVPGDRVDNLMGTLLINGEHSPPPHSNFLWSGWSENRIDLELGPLEYYVLGDNRTRSYDSRDFGPIGQSMIIGVPVYRIGPAGRRGPIGKED